MPVVGEGSFGCVHSPSLKCKTKRNINYDNKVSKLLTDKDAKDELKELSLFKEIDKLEEHYLGYPRKCKPMDDEETKQEIEKCRDGKKFIKKYKDLRLLIMENGGVSLDDYVSSLYYKRHNEETTKHTEIMFLNIMNVLRGVKFLIDNKLCHKDLKSQNIVFNEGTTTMKMIDFGMLQNFGDMKTNALIDKYWPSQTWWSVPIYAELMNKLSYERLQYLFNDEKNITGYLKHLMSKVSPINDIGGVNSQFFKQLTKSPSIIKKRLFGELKKSLELIVTMSHTEFVDKFCKINDIHNMGFTLLMILTRLEPDYELTNVNTILSKKFIADVRELGLRMISYDFFNHIEIDEVLREYERILIASKIVERNGYMITKDKKATIKRGSPIVQPDVLLVNARSSSVKDNSLQQCLEGYERNPQTRRCIKVCKKGYTRDEKFKCKSLNPRGRPRKSVLKTSKTRKICNDGKELNPKTNRCVKKCNDGYSRNDVFKCVKTKKNRLSSRRDD